MASVIVTNQMLCAIGENLVSAQLMAHGWPTCNVNHSINNFKNIDLLCQKSVDDYEVVGIQVKTSTKESFPVGFTNEQASDIKFLSKKIVGPWVFVHVKSLNTLDVDFYVVPREALIKLLYQGHDWYLNQWNRPATVSLKASPAVMQLRWLQGQNDSSKKSSNQFINPYPGDIFRQDPLNWDKIW